MLDSIQDRLAKLSTLTKDEQLQLNKDILIAKPEWIHPYWWLRPCSINVLVVTDGALNFSVGRTGFSNFLTIFKQLEDESNIGLEYKVTLGHRSAGASDFNMQVGNPDIDRRIKGFRFDNEEHFTPSMYDQVWLFGIEAGPDMEEDETLIIANYMNNGGGVFATGDHGTLGNALCGNIVRVQDMRSWDGGNEVDMRNEWRNDTNEAKPGEPRSYWFRDEEDEYPQRIYPRFYGADPNILPHPVLSSPTNIHPDGVLNTMPDHPHEGQCKEETTFVVTDPKTGLEHSIDTQNIAISVVKGGNVAETSSKKDPTIPHCFPSIGVFDGRPGNVGRIVVDATWHHFLNYNLSEFDERTMQQIHKYFKNIAVWITRKKKMFCLYRRPIVKGLATERIIEASTFQPDLTAKDLPLNELSVIGGHLRNVVANMVNPAFAQEFTSEMFLKISPQMAEQLDVFSPNKKEKVGAPWVNQEVLADIALGYATVQLRDQLGELTEPIGEKMELEIDRLFEEGLKAGLARATESMETAFSSMAVKAKSVINDSYEVNGTVKDAKGNPAAGMTVIAYDADSRASADLLGRPVQTNENGEYTISYKYTDFNPNGDEEGAADIVVYVYNQDFKEVGKSDLWKDAPAHSTIDVQLK
ncbi:MAG: hypothetical protein AAFQ98_00820 [Bacteroidota bacterium]